LRVCSLVKRPSEKVIKICIDLSVSREGRCVVEGVQVTGDFFAERPERIDRFIESVRGADAAGVDWVRLIRELAADSRIYGVSDSSLEELGASVSKAVRKACGGGTLA